MFHFLAQRHGPRHRGAEFIAPAIVSGSLSSATDERNTAFHY
jgi:hypothetical protein